MYESVPSGRSVETSQSISFSPRTGEGPRRVREMARWPPARVRCLLLITRSSGLLCWICSISCELA